MVYSRKNIAVRMLFVLFFSVILFYCDRAGSDAAEGRGALSSKSFTATLHYVADGDSFVVKTRGKEVAIRLWGIDAPEFDQPYSNASKNWLEQVLSGNIITIFPKYLDRYGRLVAVAEAGNVLVNSSSVAHGCAWVHRYYCKEMICEHWYELEEKARRTRAGLWADDAPLEPWVWKTKK
ncbi:MAG: thermonuclease family protein [Desulfocapsaceae bacterium]|jgi:endonuclease YncB( thermonuclease family)|nr:thermonuclease family protein [Desulfocapsaceae bacterium]